MRRTRFFLLLLAMVALSGCNLTVLDPAGDVAAQQGDLIIYATVMMLLVIVPVIALTIFFAIKYRASNEDATYEPDWDHSISLEIIIWSVPLAIIICLAGLTWVATHRLDPYQPLSRIDAETPIDPAVEPMVIQVVAMDWKWLFLYPEYGIATVNEAAAIVDRPVEFQITSDTVMNAFYIPEMAGMIYAMAGMQTELNAVINEPGTFKGISGNYSGAGFSHMNFDFHGMSESDFDAWVDTVRSEGSLFDRAAYLALAKPSENHPIKYFSGIEDALWDRIVNMCVGEDRLCLNDQMMVDALGGGGLEGLWNREIFAGICSVDDPGALLALLRPEMQSRSGEIVAAILPPDPSLGLPMSTPETPNVAN
jgi:cytochrome o ubiquinol oxidase subunit 2